MPETMVVLGCGSIGQRHIRNLISLGVARIVAFDQDPERLRLAVALGATPAASLSAALAGAPAVLVCTPPTAHLDGMRRALEGGSHVFVEKPVAAVLVGLDDVAALAQRQGRIVMVGYNLRFHSGLVRLHELLAEGVIGRLLSVQAEFGHALPAWRPAVDYRTTYTARRAEGGGILLDASHEIDYVRWLIGEIDSVAAMTGKLSDLEMDAEDTALLLLRASSGVLASVHLDCVQAAYRRGCRMVGSDGVLVWDYLTGVSRHLASEGIWREEPLVPDPNDMYLAELANFLASVDGREVPRVTLDDGRRALEIVIAARRSAAEGREVPV